MDSGFRTTGDRALDDYLERLERRIRDMEGAKPATPQPAQFQQPVSILSGLVEVASSDRATAYFKAGLSFDLTRGWVLTEDSELVLVDIADFVASGASHARGAVPDPGASAGTANFLREDGTWATPPGTGSSPADIVLDGTVQTTDSTVTTVITRTQTDLTTEHWYVWISALRDDATEGGNWIRGQAFRRSGGTVTAIGISTDNIIGHSDDVTWAVTMSISGTSVRVRVAGAIAKTVNWKAKAFVQQVP